MAALVHAHTKPVLWWHDDCPWT